MNSMKFTHTSSLRGELTVPGDKSISHRSVMFGALADGLTEIHGFLQGADCLSTISCFSKMGISIENQGETVLVHGRGLHGLTAPDSVLDCGNSGTTTRLISGILSAQKFDTTLTGDASIQKRPMKRIIDPLSQMGAKIESVNGNGCAPLHITGSPLHGIHYNSPVASAQVKSSILLAGLYADGETRVTEPYISRDHSERMLSAFGADIHTEGTTVIRDAAELKVKESNRIAVMVENLTAMGADVTETEDGMIIHGGKPLHGAVIDSKKDHRIAMTFAVAALGASGETEILDADCVNISYPGFYGDLKRLCK